MRSEVGSSLILSVCSSPSLRLAPAAPPAALPRHHLLPVHTCIVLGLSPCILYFMVSMSWASQAELPLCILYFYGISGCPLGRRLLFGPAWLLWLPPGSPWLLAYPPWLLPEPPWLILCLSLADLCYLGLPVPGCSLGPWLLLGSQVAPGASVAALQGLPGCALGLLWLLSRASLAAWYSTKASWYSTKAPWYSN